MSDYSSELKKYLVGGIGLALSVTGSLGTEYTLNRHITVGDRKLSDYAYSQVREKLGSGVSEAISTDKGICEALGNPKECEDPQRWQEWEDIANREASKCKIKVTGSIKKGVLVENYKKNKNIIEKFNKVVNSGCPS